MGNDVFEGDPRYREHELVTEGYEESAGMDIRKHQRIQRKQRQRHDLG